MGFHPFHLHSLPNSFTNRAELTAYLTAMSRSHSLSRSLQAASSDPFRPSGEGMIAHSRSTGGGLAFGSALRVLQEDGVGHHHAGAGGAAEGKEGGGGALHYHVTLEQEHVPYRPTAQFVENPFTPTVNVVCCGVPFFSFMKNY